MLRTMGKLASFVKGYTLGTVFVLVHVITHEMRTHEIRTREMRTRSLPR